MRRVRFIASFLAMGLLFALASTALTAPAVVASQAGSGGEFVAVDLDARQMVSGKTLVIAAYSVILGLFCLYGVSLITRERAVKRQLYDLQRRLKNENEK